MILFVRFKLCEFNVGIMLLVQMMLFIFLRRVLPVLHEPSGPDGPSDLFAVCFFRPSTALGASASCLLFFLISPLHRMPQRWAVGLGPPRRHACVPPAGPFSWPAGWSVFNSSKTVDRGSQVVMPMRRNLIQMTHVICIA